MLNSILSKHPKRSKANSFESLTQSKLILKQLVVNNLEYNGLDLGQHITVM